MFRSGGRPVGVAPLLALRLCVGGSVCVSVASGWVLVGVLQMKINEMNSCWQHKNDGQVGRRPAQPGPDQPRPKKEHTSRMGQDSGAGLREFRFRRVKNFLAVTVPALSLSMCVCQWWCGSVGLQRWIAFLKAYLDSRTLLPKNFKLCAAHTLEAYSLLPRKLLHQIK